MMSSMIRRSIFGGGSSRTLATRSRPSPTVRKQQSVRSPSVLPTITHFKPLLQLAHRDGRIDMSPTTAVSFLEDFEGLRGNKQLHKQNVTKLLDQHALEPTVLYQLGDVISRQAGKSPAKLLIRALYQAGVELQDESAALAITDEAIRLKQPDHDGVQTALRLLNARSTQGSINATERLAAISELRGEGAQAMSFAQSVLAARRSQSPEEKEVAAAPIPAWKIVARLRRAAGDIEGCEIATEFGAREFKDPRAYQELATLVAARSPALELNYLLKAATFGLSPAAYAVGEIFLNVATGTAGSEKYSSALPPLFGIVDTRKQAAKALILNVAAQWFQCSLASSPKDNIDAQKRSAQGAIAALQAIGHLQGCHELLAQYAGAQWIAEMPSIGEAGQRG